MDSSNKPSLSLSVSLSLPPLLPSPRPPLSFSLLSRSLFVCLHRQRGAGGGPRLTFSSMYLQSH